MTSRRLLVKAGLATASSLTMNPIVGIAQSRGETVRIVVGFPAGGTADAITRRLADKLRGQLAPNVIVENKPGAGGQIAVTTVKDSSPDGSTLLMTPSSCLSIYPFTYPNKLPYKIADLTPISTTAFFDHALAIGPAVPESVKTLKDFMTWTRANPSKANYGSPAPGSMPHMIASYISKLNNLGWTHVPYRGSIPGVQDLLGGQISAMSTPLGDFLQHVKAGKLRLLAVSGKQRSPFSPNTPTYREQGFPISVSEWYGLYLPSGAPAQLQRRLAAYTQTALAQSDLISSMQGFGLNAQSSNPDTAAALLRSDGEEWRRLIKLIGFNAES